MTNIFSSLVEDFGNFSCGEIQNMPKQFVGEDLGEGKPPADGGKWRAPSLR